MSMSRWSRLPLRALWRKVHPDLFASHAHAQSVNQNSMQELSAYLTSAAQVHDALSSGARPPLVSCELKFFVNEKESSSSTAAPLRDVSVSWKPPRLSSYLTPSAAAQQWADTVERNFDGLLRRVDPSFKSSAPAQQEGENAPSNMAAGAFSLLRSVAQQAAARRQAARDEWQASRAGPQADRTRSRWAATQSGFSSQKSDDEEAGRTEANHARTKANRKALEREAWLALRSDRLFFAKDVPTEQQPLLREKLRKAMAGLGRSYELITDATPVHPPIWIHGQENAAAPAGFATLRIDFDASAVGRSLCAASVVAARQAGKRAERGRSADKAAAAAEKLRAALRCETVGIGKAEPALALACINAMLSKVAELRSATDTSWEGISIYVTNSESAGVTTKDRPYALRDGVGGGAVLLAAANATGAGVSAFARRHWKLLRAAQLRHSLSTSVADNLGLADVSAYGLSTGRDGDERAASSRITAQLSSLRQALHALRSGRLLLPPASARERLHVVLGASVSDSAVREPRRSARVWLPDAFDADELSAALHEAARRLHTRTRAAG